MRPPPPLPLLPLYPVIGGMSLLALGVSIAKFRGIDVSVLYCDPRIQDGQLWRLVTAILPHGDWLHLLFNLYWVWTLGTVVEEVFGHARTFLFVLLMAVISSGSEWTFQSGGIGLSGVGYGIFGLLLVLDRHHPKFRGVIDQSTISAFVLWFFICIVTTRLGWMNVANLAHAVGWIVGACIGWTIARPKHAWKFSTGLGISAVALVLTAMYARPWLNIDSTRGMEEARLGEKALWSNDMKEAEKWNRRAIALQPNNAIAWNNLSVALHRQGREEWQAAFQRATELRGNVPGTPPVIPPPPTTEK